MHQSRAGDMPLWPWEDRRQRARRLRSADGVATRRSGRDAIVTRLNDELITRLARVCSRSREPCSSRALRSATLSPALRGKHGGSTISHAKRDEVRSEVRSPARRVEPTGGK